MPSNTIMDTISTNAHNKQPTGTLPMNTQDVQPHNRVDVPDINTLKYLRLSWELDYRLMYSIHQ